MERQERNIAKDLEFIKEQFRFSLDDPNEYNLNKVDKFASKEIVRNFINNGLPINNELLPQIFEQLSRCCQILNLNIKYVKAYVFPSETINASCFFSSDENCIIGISSKIIELLSYEELAFVIGHEIGHAIYGHNEYPSPKKNDSDYELFKLFRASEISADRIGFLCCKSYEDSLKALIKISSGLTEKYINFDFRSFVGQLRELEKLPTSKNQLFSTHPSLIIRSRALLWFSMSDLFNNFTKNNTPGSIKKDEIEKLIESDLYTYIDKSSQDEINKIKEDFRLWVYIYGCASDNKFSTEEQRVLVKYFNEDTRLKLNSFLNDLNAYEVLPSIKQRVIDLQIELSKKSKLAIRQEVYTVIEYFNELDDSENKINFIKENLNY